MKIKLISKTDKIKITIEFYEIFRKIKISKKIFVKKTKNFLAERLRMPFDFSDDPGFCVIARPIISNTEYQKLKYIQHHYNSIYEHSLKVAHLSYRLGCFLSKFFQVRVAALTRGSLLHDFFLYDWHEKKFPKGKCHEIEHPKIALENSLKCFAHLGPVEKDVIEKHMWPVCKSFPKYKETWIITITDKIIAINEFIMEKLEGRHVMKKTFTQKFKAS